MNENKNLVMAVAAVALLLLIGGVAFIAGQDTAEPADNMADNPSEQQDGTSMLNDDEPVETTSISLAEYGVSAMVPVEVEQVSTVTVYKRYSQIENCAYVGQSTNRDLKVLAYETGADCLINDRAEATGERTVGDYTLNTFQSAGNSGDTLLIEQVDLENNVSMAFLYKDKFSEDVRPEVAEILESFTVEISN